MGDDDDLRDAGQPGQTTSELHGGFAADAGVDLVEDEGHGGLARPRRGIIGPHAAEIGHACPF